MCDGVLRCLCVCVCFLPIHSGHQVPWTYQPGSHRRKVTQKEGHRISHPPSFCGACLNFPREKDSAIHFPRRLWSRILCTNDLIVLHALGIFILFFSFLVRKIPFAGIELTSQRVRGLRGTSELPGRPGSGLFLMFFWCPCMAINANLQYNGGLLPDIILLTQCYYHRGTRLNAMKRFCICSL